MPFSHQRRKGSPGNRCSSPQKSEQISKSYCDGAQSSRKGEAKYLKLTNKASEYPSILFLASALRHVRSDQDKSTRPAIIARAQQSECEQAATASQTHMTLCLTVQDLGRRR